MPAPPPESDPATVRTARVRGEPRSASIIADPVRAGALRLPEVRAGASAPADPPCEDRIAPYRRRQQAPVLVQNLRSQHRRGAIAAIEHRPAEDLALPRRLHVVDRDADRRDA